MNGDPLAIGTKVHETLVKLFRDRDKRNDTDVLVLRESVKIIRINISKFSCSLIREVTYTIKNGIENYPDEQWTKSEGREECFSLYKTTYNFCTLDIFRKILVNTSDRWGPTEQLGK